MMGVHTSIIWSAIISSYHHIIISSHFPGEKNMDFSASSVSAFSILPHLQWPFVFDPLRILHTSIARRQVNMSNGMMSSAGIAPSYAPWRDYRSPKGAVGYISRTAMVIEDAVASLVTCSVMFVWWLEVFKDVRIEVISSIEVSCRMFFSKIPHMIRSKDITATWQRMLRPKFSWEVAWPKPCFLRKSPDLPVSCELCTALPSGKLTYGKSMNITTFKYVWYVNQLQKLPCSIVCCMSTRGYRSIHLIVQTLNQILW